MDEKNQRDDEQAEEFQIVSEQEEPSVSKSDDTTETSDNDSLIRNLQAELEKAKNEQLYIRADFDNYRKRATKERSEYVRYSGEQGYTQLLEVLDNFERALQSEITSENVESFRRGVQLIADSFRSTLKKIGIEEVPSEGKPFDPLMHEAISSEETTAVPPGNIARVFKKTYKFHDKVIRPGQVVVATEKAEKKE